MTLWHNCRMEFIPQDRLHLPCFAAPLKTRFPWNVIMSFHWSSIFEIATAKTRSYAVISCGELHSGYILTSLQLWASGRPHSFTSTKTSQSIFHTTTDYGCQSSFSILKLDQWASTDCPVHFNHHIVCLFLFISSLSFPFFPCSIIGNPADLNNFMLDMSVQGNMSRCLCLPGLFLTSSRWGSGWAFSEQVKM